MSYSLRDNVVKTTSGKIKYRQREGGGQIHYHIGVWLATSNDDERDAVRVVEYLLHPSFTRRQRSSSKVENDFSITFWAWGAFEIVAKVHFIDTDISPLELRHRLNISLPKDTGSNYERVN